jgi:shikimate kinase
MNLGWSDRDEAIAAEIASLARASLYRRPITLAGFMGVGKSTLGRLLAEVLERPCYDTDGAVEEATGRSVDSFFPHDEPEFRRHEAEAVAALLERGPSLIALGGGALLNDRSRALLRHRSLLVHLHVPWTELRQHVPALIASRPLLRGKSLAEIHRLYLVRLATYRQAALRITVGRAGTAEAAADVLRALRALEPQRDGNEGASRDRTRAVMQALSHVRPLDELELERTV